MSEERETQIGCRKLIHECIIKGVVPDSTCRPYNAPYQACIVPVLLYGSETWTLLKVDLKHLEAFHMRCQRRILGVG